MGGSSAQKIFPARVLDRCEVSHPVDCSELQEHLETCDDASTCVYIVFQQEISLVDVQLLTNHLPLFICYSVNGRNYRQN